MSRLRSTPFMSVRNAALTAAVCVAILAFNAYGQPASPKPKSVAVSAPSSMVRHVTQGRASTIIDNLVLARKTVR
jgi:hypothetical protein